MEQIVIYLLVVQKLLNLKQKLLNYLIDIMKKTGLNQYVYDISVDHDFIAIDNTLDIHKYLMKKSNIT